MASAPSSWTVPLLGDVAAEPLPGWLVVALQSGYLTVNRLGGFTDEVTGRYCVAGDTVHREADGNFSFSSEIEALAA